MSTSLLPRCLNSKLDIACPPAVSITFAESRSGIHTNVDSEQWAMASVRRRCLGSGAAFPGVDMRAVGAHGGGSVKVFLGSNVS